MKIAVGLVRKAQLPSPKAGFTRRVLASLRPCLHRNSLRRDGLPNAQVRIASFRNRKGHPSSRPCSLSNTVSTGRSIILEPSRAYVLPCDLTQTPAIFRTLVFNLSIPNVCHTATDGFV